MATSWATLSNKQQMIFYMHHSTDRIYIPQILLPVGMSNRLIHDGSIMGDSSDDPSCSKQTLGDLNIVSYRSHTL